MKRMVSVLIVTGLGFISFGCAAPESDSGEKNTSPPVKVRAGKILKEFEENEAAADGKYKGKNLQVAGFVDKVDTDVLDEEKYVVRVGTPSDFNIITVNCNDQTSADVKKVKKKQPITVVGTFEDGGDLGVELKDCKIK